MEVRKQYNNIFNGTRLTVQKYYVSTMRKILILSDKVKAEKSPLKDALRNIPLLLDI
jgi:hypothetical protein